MGESAPSVGFALAARIPPTSRFDPDPHRRCDRAPCDQIARHAHRYERIAASADVLRVVGRGLCEACQIACGAAGGGGLAEMAGLPTVIGIIVFGIAGFFVSRYCSPALLQRAPRRLTHSAAPRSSAWSGAPLRAEQPDAGATRALTTSTLPNSGRVQRTGSLHLGGAGCGDQLDGIGAADAATDEGQVGAVHVQRDRRRVGRVVDAMDVARR